MSSETHFAAPGARELLLDEPEACPWYPRLVLTGLAIAPGEEVHIILSTPLLRAHLGPDTATVARRAAIVAGALEAGRPHMDPALATATADWILLCWEMAVEQVAEAIARPSLEQI